MNIAVAGANGFIGRSLCQKFLNEGDTVSAFFNNNKSSVPDGCSVYSISNLPKTKIDCLVIAIGSHNSSHQQYLDQYALMHFLIKHLVFYKVIFISSVEVYGRSKDIIKVSSCFNQPNTYGLSKLSQEFLIRSCDRFTIIRPTYTYGWGMNENSLIPLWKNSALKKKEIIVFGNGEREQDYLYIDDLVELCFLAAKNDFNHAVIAAFGCSVSNINLAKEISKNIKGTIVKCTGEDKTISSRFDISETTQIYGWHPGVSIEDGLKNYFKNENTDL